MSNLSEEERVPSPPNTPYSGPATVGEHAESGQLKVVTKHLQEANPMYQKSQKQGQQQKHEQSQKHEQQQKSKQQQKREKREQPQKRDQSQRQKQPQKLDQPQIPEEPHKYRQGLGEPKNEQPQKQEQQQEQEQQQKQEQRQEEEVLQEGSKDNVSQSSGEEERKGKPSGGEHQEKSKKVQHSSRFIKHVTTSYPILTVTYHEVNSRLPIRLPKPSNIPLYEHFPSPASLPVISSIDNLLDKILTRFDHTFPLLTSPPEEVFDRVAEVIDPWVAPVNSWLEGHLPKPKKTTRKRFSKRRGGREHKRVSTEQPPGARSYAETAAVSESDVIGAAGSDTEASGGGEDMGDQELELVRTLGILMESLEAQLENVEDTKTYVKNVILPSYVPVVGGWHGVKERIMGEQQRKGTDTEGVLDRDAGKAGHPQTEEVEKTV